MSRPKRREPEPLFDPELADLPEGARWREWLGRVEAAIFASPTPTPREALARLVGKNCNLDDLLSDIRDELRARPYELVQVAGGWQLRTKARYADAIRALNNGARDAGPPELTPTELLAVTTIAYLQPATRAELSRLVGKEVSRDVIGRLKSLDLIAAGPRAPEPGAPYAYVTTLEVFGGVWIGKSARTAGYRKSRGRWLAATARERGRSRWRFGNSRRRRRSFRKGDGVRGRRARRHDR